MGRRTVKGIVKLILITYAIIYIGWGYLSDGTSLARKGYSLDEPFTEIKWPTKEYSNIEALPDADLTDVNYYIVFDASGSMWDRECSDGKMKIHVAKDALNSFANQVPENARLGMLTFDKSGVVERVPLAKNNRENFRKIVSKIMPGGGTPLKSAMKKGLESLDKQAAAQLGYGEYHLVVLTDGIANRGQEPDSVVRTILGSTPVTIHTIGFCIGNKHSLNVEGGVLYKNATNPQELEKGLQSVLAEAEAYSDENFS